MIIKIKRKVLERGILSVFALITIVSILIGVSFTTNYAHGELTNVTNATVFAVLNVTNTNPNITSVILDDSDYSVADLIDLTANAETVVSCNATVFDYNGWQDIDPDSVNATIYVKSGSDTIDSPDDNNTHYTNRSCGRCVQGASSTEAICDCQVAMQYYANDTTWTCNISITDRAGSSKDSPEINSSSTGVDTATVTKLLALDTPTTIIDYGNLSVTEISKAISRNITNAGNVDFNLTLRGFGGTNDTAGEIYNNTVAMICEFGNISFDNHRYVIGENVTFNDMKNLTNQTTDTNFTLPQRTNDGDGTRTDINETFWRLEIPLSVGGLCNGTIVFGAMETLE